MLNLIRMRNHDLLTDAFWRGFELDLAEIKMSYLNWALGYAREPEEQYRHLFLWPEQTEFCAVNSRYGRAFAISPSWPWSAWCAEPKEGGHFQGVLMRSMWP